MKGISKLLSLTVIDKLLESKYELQWKASPASISTCEVNLLRIVSQEKISQSFFNVISDSETGNPIAVGVVSRAELENERIRLISMIEGEHLFDFEKICSQLIEVLIRTIQDTMKSDSPNVLGFDTSVLSRVHTCMAVPFGEPWSEQFDLSFEAGAQGGELIACPDANVFSPNLVSAWNRLAARPGRVHRDYLHRCFKALPHEIVHCMQTKAGMKDNRMEIRT